MEIFAAILAAAVGPWQFQLSNPWPERSYGEVHREVAEEHSVGIVFFYRDGQQAEVNRLLNMVWNATFHDPFPGTQRIEDADPTVLDYFGVISDGPVQAVVLKWENRRVIRISKKPWRVKRMAQVDYLWLHAKRKHLVNHWTIDQYASVKPGASNYQQAQAQLRQDRANLNRQLREIKCA